MDADLIFKIAAPVVLLIATRLIGEMGYVRLTRIRERYDFVKKFAQDLRDDSNMHPRQRLLGMQAATGMSGMKPEIMEHLWSMKRSTAFDDFKSCGSLCKLVCSDGLTKLCFKRGYRSAKSRMVRKSLMFIGYFASYSMIYWPAILDKTAGISLKSTPQFWQLYGLSAVCIIYAVFTFLRMGARITRAEHLVADQALFVENVQEGPKVISASNPFEVIGNTKRVDRR